MRLDLPDLLPLVCPACAARTERGIELRSLEVERGLKLDGGEVVEGILRCTGCPRRYPILDGVPVVVRDLAALLSTAAFSLLGRDVAPEVLGLLAESAGSDQAPVAHEAMLASSYLDASWGDRAEPRPDGPGEPFGFAALAGKLASREGARVGRAVELGCGVGRGLAQIARGADLAIGLDASPWALRCARRLLAGERLAYARRSSGRTFFPAAIEPGSLAAPAAQLLCADALSPPLTPGTFDRVVALNLLDTVRSPLQLLDVAVALLARGGELLVAAPYAWKSALTEDHELLQFRDPAAALRREVEARGLRIEDEDLHVPWTLRRDARAASLYDVHYLLARKP